MTIVIFVSELSTGPEYAIQFQVKLYIFLKYNRTIFLLFSLRKTVIRGNQINRC